MAVCAQKLLQPYQHKFELIYDWYLCLWSISKAIFL